MTGTQALFEDGHPKQEEQEKRWVAIWDQFLDWSKIFNIFIEVLSMRFWSVLKSMTLDDLERTDRQTDRQTTYDGKTALCTKVHRAVKMIK